MSTTPQQHHNNNPTTPQQQLQPNQQYHIDPLHIHDTFSVAEFNRRLIKYITYSNIVLQKSQQIVDMAHNWVLYVQTLQDEGVVASFVDKPIEDMDANDDDDDQVLLDLEESTGAKVLHYPLKSPLAYQYAEGLQVDIAQLLQKQYIEICEQYNKLDVVTFDSTNQYSDRGSLQFTAQGYLPMDAPAPADIINLTQLDQILHNQYQEKKKEMLAKKEKEDEEQRIKEEKQKQIELAKQKEMEKNGQKPPVVEEDEVAKLVLDFPAAPPPPPKEIIPSPFGRHGVQYIVNFPPTQMPLLKSTYYKPRLEEDV